MNVGIGQKQQQLDTVTRVMAMACDLADAKRAADRAWIHFAALAALYGVTVQHLISD